MNEQRKYTDAGGFVLLLACILFPGVLYLLFRWSIIGNASMTILESMYFAYGVSALYFSVFFTLSVVKFRNPHWLSGLFAFGMLIWVVAYTCFVCSVLASV